MTTASPVVDAGADRELEAAILRVELLDRLEDPQRRPHRALGVVLVRDGRTEHRHHRVADELLDGAAEALDLLFQASVVRPQRRADVLGIGLLGLGREPDEVDEQDGDDLAFFGSAVRVSASAAPHDQQNLARPGFSSPHWGHAGILESKKVAFRHKAVRRLRLL